jgi:hypothetical protein
VSSVKYELGFYIPEDAILHSHCREILKSYLGFSVTERLRPIPKGVTSLATREETECKAKRK